VPAARFDDFSSERFETTKASDFWGATPLAWQASFLDSIEQKKRDKKHATAGFGPIRKKSNSIAHR
jgi:hypothetical protein